MGVVYRAERPVPLEARIGGGVEEELGVQGWAQEQRAELELSEAERLRKSRARIGRRPTGFTDAEREAARADAELKARGLLVHPDAPALVVAHDEPARALAEGDSRGQRRVVAVQVLGLAQASDLPRRFDRGGAHRAEHEAIHPNRVGLALEFERRCAPTEPCADRRSAAPEGERGGRLGVRRSGLESQRASPGEPCDCRPQSTPLSRLPRETLGCMPPISSISSRSASSESGGSKRTVTPDLFFSASPVGWKTPSISRARLSPTTDARVVTDRATPCSVSR